MIIYDNKWHYRFNVWSTSEYTTKRKSGVCNYFWFTVYNILILAIKWLFLPAVVIFLVGAIGAIIIEERALNISMWWAPLVGSALTAGGVGALAVFFSIVHYTRKAAIWIFRRSPIPKTPSLLMEYIKARKAKFCPTITFEKVSTK